MKNKIKEVSQEDIELEFLGYISNDKTNYNNIKELYEKYNYIDKDLRIEKYTIDFHHHTIEESWEMFIRTLKMNIRCLNVITGASGVLKLEFPKWLDNPNISSRIISWKPINNGSFQLILRDITKMNL